MSGFKLLVIMILTGSNKRFLNNLKEGQIYKFYQNYSFKDVNGVEILQKNKNLDCVKVTVDEKKQAGLNLYSSKENISINVCVVVAETGSVYTLTLHDLLSI